MARFRKYRSVDVRQGLIYLFPVSKRNKCSVLDDGESVENFDDRFVR